MIGDYVLPLIGLVVGVELLTLVVAVRLLPSLRRSARARALLDAELADRTAALRALAAERRSRARRSGAPAPVGRLARIDSVEGSVT